MSTDSTTYTVTGMTCGHCVAAVTEEVAEIPGVTAVDVDLGQRSAVTVTSDAAASTTRAVRAAVDEAGYELAGR